MKVRGLFLVAAFVLGGLAVAYWGDAIDWLREYEHTSPLCKFAETAWADASGASRAWLEAELATQKDMTRRVLEERDTAILELATSEARADMLATEVLHLTHVREALSEQLDDASKLLAAHQSLVKETNWRYEDLVRRVRALGSGSIPNLVAE